MKSVLIVIAGLLVLIGLGWFLTMNDLAMQAFFAPRVRAIESHTFKMSEQYNEGMIRDLENLRLQYVSASGEQKQAIKSTILHRFEVFDAEQLTPDLRRFYQTLTTGGEI